MVNFKKRLSKPLNEKPLDPLEIYSKLDRASDAGPLRPAQEAILSEWHKEFRDNRDVILKLHTGQGKTLIGLLLLHSKLNQNEGTAIYLCPNNYLVSQTIGQAKKFGVNCVTADGDLPDAFLEGKSILVTSVSKLFNGKTKFKLGAQSIPVSYLLMDDAHTCIETIKEAFTIRLDIKHPAYIELLNLFSNDLAEQGAGTFADIRRGEYDALLPVPYWSWFDRHSEVVDILARQVATEEISFAWPLIKDVLADCFCLVSGKSIEISPYAPPLDLFGSFNKAKHRVFMSATVTDDSFLIKGLELSEATISNPLVYKSETWSGEKMILIPSLIDDSLTDTEIANEFGKPNPPRKVGVVALCPSFESAKIWKAAGAQVASKDDIEGQVERLKNGDCGRTLVVVNRYDGIDLPDDSCRVLVIDSKPFSASLHDRYLESVREGSQVISTKVARSIEQGLGRAVRGEKDYCAIVMTGTDLVRCVRTKESRKYFSDQTRNQIEIGLEVAEWAKEEINNETSAIKILRNVIGQCLGRDDDWKAIYAQRMNELTYSRPESKVSNIFAAELKADQKYKELRFEEAVAIIQEICDTVVINNNDRGWYLQEMARLIYPQSKVRSNELQVAAHKQNRYLLKPKTGMVFSRVVIQQKRLENLMSWVKEHKTYEEMSITVDDILSKLSFGVKAESFEKAFNELAPALGFAGQRPDKEWKEGPDNLWALSDDEYLLIECKSEVNLNRSEISKQESGQMNNAAAWFKNKYFGVKAKGWMVIPMRQLGQGAGFNEEVDVLRDKGLIRLVKNIRGFFSEFKGLDFDSLSESKVQEFLESHDLTVANLLTKYSDSVKQYGSR